MTDQDVIDLYRCLLGRAPENANTIAAFRHYYPDFDAGRRAVLKSDEFKLYAAQVTGEAKRGAVGAPLALALLQAAGGFERGGDSLSDPALRQGFGLQIAQLEQARLGVVVGDDARLDDIAAMGGTDAALLHIGATPQGLAARALADGTAVLQSSLAPLAACEFLAGQGAEIDALFVLGPPADVSWLPLLLTPAPAAVACGGQPRRRIRQRGGECTGCGVAAWRAAAAVAGFRPAPSGWLAAAGELCAA